MPPLSTQEPTTAEFVVFYDGLGCGVRGRTIAETAARKMHGRVTVNLYFWSLGILAIPNVCLRAGRICARADIIILAVPEWPSILVGEGKQFIDWLAARELNDCLLILDADEHFEAASPPQMKREIVTSLRLRLGVPCLPTSPIPSQDSENGSPYDKNYDPGLPHRRVERAQPHHRWGINE